MEQFSDPHLITTVSIANNSLKKKILHTCFRPCAKCLALSCHLTSLGTTQVPCSKNIISWVTLDNIKFWFL